VGGQLVDDERKTDREVRASEIVAGVAEEEKGDGEALPDGQAAIHGRAPFARLRAAFPVRAIPAVHMRAFNPSSMSLKVPPILVCIGKVRRGIALR